MQEAAWSTTVRPIYVHSTARSEGYARLLQASHLPYRTLSVEGEVGSRLDVTFNKSVPASVLYACMHGKKWITSGFYR